MPTKLISLRTYYEATVRSNRSNREKVIMTINHSDLSYWDQLVLDTRQPNKTCVSDAMEACHRDRSAGIPITQKTASTQFLLIINET